MFIVNDDLSIYANRGDIVFFNVSADDHGTPYKFQPGDIVRISIYGRKDAETVSLQKDFPVSEVSETVFIYLEEQDTKIGEPISKHKDYWYEVVLNPDTMPQTIIGYDEDGAKVFRLFPESEEIEDDYNPQPEDFPVVDEELDMTSPRPVSNRAIARAVTTILDTCERTNQAVAELHVTPEMFGAIGDGKADDTESLQNAIDNCSGALSLGSKTYYVTGTIFVKSNTSIVGNGAKIVRASSAGKVANIFRGVDVEHITIEGIEFVSTHDQDCVNVSINGNNTVSNIDAVHFGRVKDLRVIDCKFSGLTGGIKVDEDLNDVTASVNDSLLVDGCVFDDTVFMPIYVGGLVSCTIRNCDISASPNGTKLCHHVYISSACRDFHIYDNSFRGGVGQVINAMSNYTGAVQPTNIHVHNNDFTDFRLLLAINGGEVFFDNNSCRSTVAGNCIYVESHGKLRMNDCKISVNTKLFDAGGFDIEMSGCTVACNGVIFTASADSFFSAKGCGFTVAGGESVLDITSAVAVKLVFKNCIFNTSLTGTKCAFLSRNAGCIVVVDGCSFYNATVKNFATDGMSGKVFVIGSNFVGFEKVFYTENGYTVSLNNVAHARVV